MRQVAIKYVGKKTTNFLNIDEVAKDLEIKPEYLLAFFGYEIGCKSTYNQKKPYIEKAYLTGIYDLTLLEDILTKFIMKVVLCKRCNLPETQIIVEKREIILDCQACGSRNPASLQEKFEKFIRNHS